MHPLLRLIATQPHLLADHAEAYAELLEAEVGQLSSAWKRRAVLNAVALCSLGVSAVLAGVALMLWAVIPGTSIQAPWALVAAPLLPFGVAALCLLAARPQVSGGGFDKLRQQLKADLLMLREAST